MTAINPARQLADDIADLQRRLAAVERAAQMAYRSIEAGALVVNDPDGIPVLTVGQQAGGGYAVTGSNGGQVVATGLDLPNGTITETDIADDAISTPKLAANAVTADKIEAGAVTADKLSATAIDGKTITGATIIAGTPGAARVEMGPTDTLYVQDDNDGTIARLDTQGLLVQSAESFAHFHAWPYPDQVIAYLGPGISNTPNTIAPAEVKATINDPGGPAEESTLTLLSPSINDGARSSIQLFAEDARAGTPLVLVDAAGGAVELQNAGFYLAGKRQGPRVPVASAHLDAVSAAFGTADTVLATIAGFVAKGSTAYEVRVSGGATGSGAAWAGLRLRETDASGQLVAAFFRWPLVTTGDATAIHGCRHFAHTSVADLTVDLVLCGYTNAGTATLYGDSDNQFVVEIFEVGDAADYPYALVI